MSTLTAASPTQVNMKTSNSYGYKTTTKTNKQTTFLNAPIPLSPFQKRFAFFNASSTWIQAQWPELKRSETRALAATCFWPHLPTQELGIPCARGDNSDVTNCHGREAACLPVPSWFQLKQPHSEVRSRQAKSCSHALSPWQNPL